MEEKTEKKIDFFSEVDIIGGKVASEYPAFYFDGLIDEISEDIRRDEGTLESGIVHDPVQVRAIRDRLKRNKQRFEQIADSRPKLTDAEQSRMLKVRNALGKEIAATMYSRSDDQKHLVNPHTEIKKMYTPSITVTPDIAELASACRVTIYDGKITREGATKIWKITGKYFGDSTNVENLRRD